MAKLVAQSICDQKVAGSSSIAEIPHMGKCTSDCKEVKTFLVVTTAIG